MGTDDSKRTMEAMLPLFKLLGADEPEIIEGDGFISWRFEVDDRVITMTIADKD